MKIDRRGFLKSAAIAGAAAAAPWTAEPTEAATSPGSLDFVFFTDVHIEPELDAPLGCDMCFAKIAKLKPEFAITGGDHVYDANAVTAERAGVVFDLYKRAEDKLKCPVHHVIGNHDTFGTNKSSSAKPGDPGYGKEMYVGRLGKTYYSFEAKGYKFIMLDSIQLTPDRNWEARIDDPQMLWLRQELAAAGPKTPIVAAVHVPLVSAFSTYSGEKENCASNYQTITVANAPDVLAAFAQHNVLAVLQGHLHVNEISAYKGTQYITSGAVCANWWHGSRMGFAEGFTVVSLRGGKISTRYETYGFKSLDPREKF
jgi:3',5'-cyclic-AMP phosphodiesterase